MSEINLQFSVNTYSASFTSSPNPIIINPVTNNLMMFTGFAAYPPAGGAGDTQVTFNDAGLFSGSDEFTYANASNTLTVQNIVANSMTSSGNVTIGNISCTGNISVVGNTLTSNLTVNNKSILGNIPNITINGGSNGQFIKTDGTGNLSFATIPSSGSNTQLQFNSAGALGGIPSVTWNGVKLALGDVANVKVDGGTNGYVLQTDGTGNLTWQAQAGNVTGNGSPGGANTQVQFNRTGVFGGAAGFTFNNISNTLTVINANVTGNLVANVFTATTISGNITTAGDLITAGNVFANSGNIQGNILIGNTIITSNLSVGGSNITANVITANYFVGPLATNAQPNITSLGVLTGLAIQYGNLYIPVGNIDVGIGNSVLGNIASANSFVGNLINGTSNIKIAASANINMSVGGNSNVFVVTSTGANVTTLSATTGTFGGNVTAANVYANTGTIGGANLVGNIITSAQTNITSLGSLTSLSVAGTTTIQQAKEKVTANATGSTGTVAFDILTQAIYLKTADATGNFIINLRGNSTTTFNSVANVNESMTFTYINKNGGTAYAYSNLQIDGSNVTVNWQSTPSGFIVNGYDIYGFNVIKTASSTYTVFGTFAGYQP